MLRNCLLLSLLILSQSVLSNNLPRPSELEPAVQFWVKVYTQVSTDQGYIHDATHLGVLYDTLTFPPNSATSQQTRMIDKARNDYVHALNSLGSGKRTGLTQLEARVLKAWPKGTDSQTFKKAAGQVRFQRGQADRFREGLIRSGQWKPHIRSALARHGLPPELEVLPHVESSFNPKAYSKVAAAGMWQFMPATARQYMQVDHIVDQRMDPYVSTEAAIRLLKRNYETTGTWPLALTAYNFGTGGIVRASQSVGTKDIATIIRKYQGPYFGFASRNFYPSFLAALEVDRNAAKYFSQVRPASPLSYDTVTTSHYIPAEALARSAQVRLEVLRDYNPALLSPVWRGEKHIPKGFELRLPKGAAPKSLNLALASIPASLRYQGQVPDIEHRVASGESLSVIARRYKTSVSALMALNGIRHAHKIRAGQMLKLPGHYPAVATSVAGAPQVATAQLAVSSISSAMTPLSYVVSRGDSLWGIARQFGVSPQLLASQNNLDHKAIIRPGQQLLIPPPASRNPA